MIAGFAAGRVALREEKVLGRVVWRGVGAPVRKTLAVPVEKVDGRMVGYKRGADGGAAVFSGMAGKDPKTSSAEQIAAGGQDQASGNVPRGVMRR